MIDFLTQVILPILKALFVPFDIALGWVTRLGPIGALIAHLRQRLAWDDASVRDLADYYRLSNLWGSGSGPQQLWPASIYSSEVRLGIDSGRLKNSGDWDDWNVAIV